MKMLKITAALLALVMLVSCGAESREPNEPEVTKSTAAKELMSADDIMDIAIEHAKSSAEGAVAEALANGTVSDKECEFTAKNGIPIYDCKFKIGILEFEYEVDQQNGAIRTYARGFDVDAPGMAGAPRIGEDAALSYALWYLDLKEADISDASSVYDEEFGDYYVRFSTGEDVYTCVISPYDGVLERSTRDIGYNGAKEIAYNHAAQNVAEDQCDDFSNLMMSYGMMTDCSTKAKGVASERTYEVRFSIGGFKYEYVIDGLSGNILKINCEPDDKWSGEPVGGFDPATVSLAKPDIPDYFAETVNTAAEGPVDEETAAQIAIDDVKPMGLYMSEIDTYLDDGAGIYHVNFEMGGTVYFYNIEAATGDIVRATRETHDFSIAPEMYFHYIEATTGDAEPDGNFDDGPANIGFIGEDIALDIALRDADDGNDAAGNVFDIETVLSFSRGYSVYQVNFVLSGYDYEYLIDAEYGEILRADKKLR